MPDVVDLVRDSFGHPPRCELNPDEVVALGAAIQSALILDKAEVADLVMTDVCPHSLGVEVTKSFGPRQEPGFFSPVIHRNTTIPVSREEIFCDTGATPRPVRNRGTGSDLPARGRGTAAGAGIAAALSRTPPGVFEWGPSAGPL